MNTEHNYISMFPSSSFGFNNNHQQFNEDGTTTISSAISLDKNYFKNNYFSSMIITNEDEQQFTSK